MASARRSAAESVDPIGRSTPAAITRHTPVSIGVMALAIAGAVGLYYQTDRVRAELLPTVARIDERVEGIAEDVGLLRQTLTDRPTRLEVQAMIRAELLDHEKRIDALERDK